MTDPTSGTESHLSAGCVSDLTFDQFLGDELPTIEAQAVQEHVGLCPRCQTRFERLKQSKLDCFIPPFEELTPQRQRPRSSVLGRTASAISLLAAAAGVALWFGVPTRQSPDTIVKPMDSRTKGAGRLGFYIKRGDRILQGGPKEVVFPGDIIEFTYSTRVDGFLAVLSLDGGGHATVYYPTGANAAAFEAGQRALPQSTRLDAVLGHEMLGALFCERPVELEPIRARLEARPESLRTISGCTVDILEVEKQQP